MKRFFVCAALCVMASAVQAQERNYTWTLSSSEALYIGSLLEAKAKAADGQLVRVLVTKLQAQITQQDQAAQAATVESFKNQVRALDKAAAAAAPPPAPAPAPTPPTEAVPIPTPAPEPKE